MSLTAEDIKKLSEPFNKDTIGIKINSFSKDRTRALLVPYVQHTDAYIRIEQVDPTWSCKTVSVSWSGETCSVRMAMTIKGVTRENVGEGGDEKSAYSDAIKRCAMLFGIGRYLYDSEKVWVPYNEKTDQYKTFTYADFAKANRGEVLPTGNAAASKTAPNPSVAVVPRTANKGRVALGKEIWEVAQKLKMSAHDLETFSQNGFGRNLKELTDSEMLNLQKQLQEELMNDGKAVS